MFVSFAFQVKNKNFMKVIFQQIISNFAFQ